MNINYPLFILGFIVFMLGIVFSMVGIGLVPPISVEFDLSDFLVGLASMVAGLVMLSLASRNEEAR